VSFNFTILFGDTKAGLSELLIESREFGISSNGGILSPNLLAKCSLLLRGVIRLDFFFGLPGTLRLLVSSFFVRFGFGMVFISDSINMI